MRRTCATRLAYFQFPITHNFTMNLESTINLAQSKNNPSRQEKSQAELRAALKAKFLSIEPLFNQGTEEYKQALKEHTFEDQEGEEEGSGEARKLALQAKLTSLLDRAEKLKAILDSKEPLPQSTPEIQVQYTHPDGHKETITLDLEAKLQDFISLYKKTNLDLPPDFEDTIRDIWDRHQDEIEQAIEQNGFDELLLIPATPNLPELSEKMKMEQGNWTSSNFDQGGGFADALSQRSNVPRLILVHKAQNLQDRPELEKTLNTKGSDVNIDQDLTLEDYLIFQRYYFETTGKHLDEVGWTWLATKSGARLVGSCWDPDAHRLNVDANDLVHQRGSLGVRPSRCFN